MPNKPNPGPWSPAENAALIALYFEMLDNALAGYAYSKAAMIRVARGDTAIDPAEFVQSWAGALANRSKQSIEFKLMNATAAHAAIINDYIDRFGSEPPSRETMHNHGYRALPNYQRALRGALEAELINREQWSGSNKSRGRL